jgi:phasin
MSVMTEATIGANNARTAKRTSSSFSTPNYEMPKFDLPKMEMPEAFREIAEKGVAQAKDNFEKIQAAAEEATDLLKGTYTTAAKGATDYNRKVIEIARTNANAAFDYAYELLGAKSPSEFIELSTAHARKQFEAMTAQTEELTELAQKVTTEMAAKDWRHGDTKKTHMSARPNR